MGASRHYIVAAGGTGGHLIPAFALAEELTQRGHKVALITDERGAKIPGLFADDQVHIMPAGRMQGGPIGWLRGLRAIMRGRRMARDLYDWFQPTAVIGFGGYPAFPAVTAAHKAGIATFIHEQNAVLGRVNRLVARRVTAIATAFQTVQRMPKGVAGKVHLIGNPVRDDVLALRDQPYPAATPDSVFRVLVTGGSQGASILSEVVPDGLSLLPAALRSRLQVTQQCRAEDIDAVRERYRGLDIPAELATYLPDLPAKMGWAHLVIARAGASTIAELTAAGRPAILVPLPSATDDHQTANARDMVEAGGARMIPQSQFTPAELAKQMRKLVLEPGSLENAARFAKNCGYPRATSDLADLVESSGGAPLMDVIRMTREANAAQQRRGLAAAERQEAQP